MHNTESMENYLETILILGKTKPVVRSVDVAEELGFKKSSVSVAMKNLRENGYNESSHLTATLRGMFWGSVVTAIVPDLPSSSKLV